MFMLPRFLELCKIFFKVKKSLHQKDEKITFVFPEVHMARTICRFLLRCAKTLAMASCPLNKVDNVSFSEGTLPYEL